MIRRPPRSTLERSSAAADVYKRQRADAQGVGHGRAAAGRGRPAVRRRVLYALARWRAVSYTHLRAHETVLDLVCRLLLEKNMK
mgnify:CR=1 FL=1